MEERLVTVSFQLSQDELEVVDAVVGTTKHKNRSRVLRECVVTNLVNATTKALLIKYHESIIDNSQRELEYLHKWEAEHGKAGKV